MEKAGFVKRQNDRQDRRKVIIRYIPKRHEKAKQYYDAMAADVHELFSAYGESKLQFLLQHSDSLTRIFQKHAEKIFKK